MTIGINGYEAVVSRFGHDTETGLPRRVGSSEYCFQLLLNLNRIDKKNEYLIYLPQSPTPDLPQESANWHYKIIKPKKMWTLFRLSLEFLLGLSRPDIFFSPTHYLPIFSPKKSAISVLDVSYLKFPELFKRSDLNQLTKWTKYSVKKAKAVFTISKASKDDIMKAYGIPGNRIVVTYPGIKALTGKNKIFGMDKFEEKYGLTKNYILFVGTLQPRKNITRLIEAFSMLKDGTELVIVGKKGWLFEEILNAPKKFKVENRVKFLDFVPDEDLSLFYKNAICFVLPSLYEGFGLPILEAMSYGCPVIASNISSLPEAGGDAALYVDPLNIEDIKKKLEVITEDADLRQKLIKKGYEQVRKFSWEKTARETLKELENIKQQI
jgi:glycosyltransferase involved in cell wall biosynthesis